MGALPDADLFGDQGSNTLGHVILKKNLYLPNLFELGLGKILAMEKENGGKRPQGAYGKMAELSPGKDTTTGHWELAGLPVSSPFLFIPRVSQEIITEFERLIGAKLWATFLFSTEIIKKWERSI